VTAISYNRVGFNQALLLTFWWLLFSMGFFAVMYHNTVFKVWHTAPFIDQPHP
jgi:hypothetical protein